MNAMEIVKQIVSVLTDDEKQLLKDTINYGSWGDGDMEFLDDNGNIETDGMMGYCTNDAKLGGHFKGCVVSTMFRSIYKKLCKGEHNKVGRYISHCNDWWCDGSGDMLFIRYAYSDAFEEWAKEKN